MTHYDDQTLFEYVEGIAPDAGAIEMHVSSCTDCAAEVREQREMMAHLGHADVWDKDPAPAPRQFVVNVVAFAERARQEEQAAVALCDKVLSGPPSWWAQRLRKSEGARTAGVVKELLERWRPMCHSNPANALHVTALALQIANGLDVAQYPCDYVVKLRAQACRDHAYVLTFMGRHPEALEHVERARRLYEQVPLPEYDLARVGTVKALILMQSDVESAVAITRQAAEVFLRFGDRARYTAAKMTEGMVLYERGSVAEALAVWKSIEGDSGLDEYNSIKLTHNLAICYAELGQPEIAAEHLQRCVPQFEMLGLDTERTRSRWLLGHTLTACGRVHEAIPVLRQAWNEFVEFDMISDAGLVALELAEALLLAGEPDEVPAICRDVIAQFTRAGMASRALTALSFLREAVAIGQATPSLIRHVHSFLRELPTEQPRLFAPPPAGVGE